MYLIWIIIVGGLIGWLSGNLIGRDVPGGILGNIVAGFIGALLGTEVLGDWGPIIGGFYIVPAIFGAVVALLIFFAIARGGGLRRR
ncbi:GlsB/YeaQ/YmgE family stress response membrane protein [Paenibacillus psychroresistens]|uniref:GlsB/YeaQ/YmgE family stress response membrane protein n=1 Tax=Paenibacillus psychroresistens TaxID=1778678 RepID=A0A6B8RLS9_9BACL|nr:GlsB/YeaQ/YmgE family stress response membrane protein [Paenibacillus psychroresistens]QGQ97351.1 GlsB/YeaQ/YmgE family stress response membrane protein [Paenibacillus psychroresistens]